MKMFVVSESWFRVEEDGRVGCLTCSCFTVATGGGKERAVQNAEKIFHASGNLGSMRLGGANVHEVKLRWLLPRIILGLVGLPLPP